MIYTSPCIVVYYDVRHGEEYKDRIFLCLFLWVSGLFFYQWDSPILKFSIFSIYSSFFFLLNTMRVSLYSQWNRIDEFINIESAHICVL